MAHIPTEDIRGPIPPHLRDDGVPVGTFSYGHNMGGTGTSEVIVKVNDSPRCAMPYRYQVVLEVRETWQAQAIAAILNAK